MINIAQDSSTRLLASAMEQLPYSTYILRSHISSSNDGSTIPKAMEGPLLLDYIIVGDNILTNQNKEGYLDQVSQFHNIDSRISMLTQIYLLRDKRYCDTMGS